MNTRALRAVLAAAAAFPAGYLLAAGLALPLIAYHPVERRLFITSQPVGVQMRFYGDVLWATAAAIAVGLAAWALGPRLPRFSPLGAVATVLALAALDVAYYLSRLLAAP